MASSAIPIRLFAALAFLIAATPAIAQRADYLSDEMKAFVAVDAPAIAIENIHVIDGTGAPARDGEAILIRDGRLDEIGTLQAGKRADLLLVRGRPDEAISDIRHVATVFKDGIGYDSAAILSAFRGRVGR